MRARVEGLKICDDVSVEVLGADEMGRNASIGKVLFLDTVAQGQCLAICVVEFFSLCTTTQMFKIQKIFVSGLHTPVYAVGPLLVGQEHQKIAQVREWQSAGFTLAIVDPDDGVLGQCLESVSNVDRPLVGQQRQMLRIWRSEERR